MTEEKYSSFEQAKALKELGFPFETEDEDCNGNRPVDKLYFHEPQEWKYYIIPTLSLVQKWLREEKNISLEMSVFRKELAGCNLFIIDEVGIKWVKDTGTYEGEDAYDKALSAGIDDALELLKKLEL